MVGPASGAPTTADAVSWDPGATTRVPGRSVSAATSRRSCPSTVPGSTICRLVRRYRLAGPPYLVLLAAGRDRTEITAGLEAGANDCLRTPVSGSELRARVHAGRRFVELPWERADRLERAAEPVTAASAVPAIDPTTAAVQATPRP